MKTEIIKKGVVLICLLSVMSAFTSCILFSNLKMAAEEGKTSVNGKQVTAESMGDPKTDCLAYGYVNVKGVHMYVQMDSSQEALYVTPLVMGNGSFCFPPLAKNLSFQLVRLRYDNWFTNSITYYTPGLGKQGTIAFTTQKAGLQFIGAYDFIVKGTAFKGYSATLSPYPRSEQSEYELKTLSKMKAQFKNTEWETLIDKRIEEIQNEKK
jgi:hypothetical protein